VLGVSWLLLASSVQETAGGQCPQTLRRRRPIGKIDYRSWMTAPELHASPATACFRQSVGFLGVSASGRNQSWIQPTADGLDGEKIIQRTFGSICPSPRSPALMRCRGIDVQALGKEILAGLGFLAKLHHSAEV